MTDPAFVSEPSWSFAYSEWECEWHGIVFRPLKGKEPNRAKRKLSTLLLGCKWRKVK